MPVRIQSEIERAALETVLASEIFVRAPNLARILRYIGSKYLKGQEDAIKEYNIGVEALGRPPDFDPKKDSIVRVEAHRLREKLKQYYETEGADHPVVISLQVGHYIPQFLHRSEEGAVAAGRSLGGSLAGPSATSEIPKTSPVSAQRVALDQAGSIAAPVSAAAAVGSPIRRRVRGREWLPALTLLVVAMVAGILAAIKLWQKPTSATPAQPARSSTPAALSEGNEVRIIAGYSKKNYLDRGGEVWSPDRYFSGGQAYVEPQVFIARAMDSTLFQTAREGEFSYSIPLKPGRYELRLYFVETDYGPGTLRGGSEISRLFQINLNGKRLLTDFDIYADAGGAFIADERVFKDVSPTPDGYLHLSFINAIDYPVLNALEIVPCPPGKIQPIRIVAQENSYTDEAGHLWSPDRYFLRGRLATNPHAVQGTPDPGLYASERFGNFDYAIPVAEGRYAVTLHFAETYFGPDNPGKGGVGSRLFDVVSNGVALLRSFDIYKEAGGDNRALVKSFHDLQPNSQGKLLLSFVPVRNYATVRAIEVMDESK